jgi:hypothetical protein
MTIKPTYDTSDLIAIFNSLPESRRWKAKHGREKYDRWNIYAILRAFRIPTVQERRGEGSRGTAMYVTHRALAKAQDGELLESILDVEALSDDAALSGANHGGAGP